MVLWKTTPTVRNNPSGDAIILLLISLKLHYTLPVHILHSTAIVIILVSELYIINISDNLLLLNREYS